MPVGETSKETLTKLIDALQDRENPRKQARAALEMRGIKDPRTIAPLVAALDEEDIVV